MRNITIEEMKNRFNAKKIDTLCGKEINIVSYLSFFDKDRNGKEYESFLFITDSGDMYRTGSKAFIKSVLRLSEIATLLGYDSIPGRVETRITSNNNTIYVMI